MLNNIQLPLCHVFYEQAISLLITQNVKCQILNINELCNILFVMGYKITGYIIVIRDV